MSAIVLIPVLGRPHRSEAVLASLWAATEDVSVMFLCSPGDDAQIRAVQATDADYMIVPFDSMGPGQWARKINRAFRRAAEDGHEWMLLAADDLEFHPGWLDAALAVHEQTGACVIGTNDLTNPTVMRGHHSTHPLVHADYAECGTVDEDDRILHEGYHHLWVDAELVETAKWRGTWAFAADSHVEHLHHLWRKSPDDATYRKGNANAQADRKLYAERRRLWA